MTTSSQLTPNMTIKVDDTIFRVDSSIKVSVPRGVPFIKAKLTNLITNESLEKNFKIDQEVEEVKLSERRLEYLYLDGKQHVFFDIDYLDQILVSSEVIHEKVNYLKEGIIVNAMLYGDMVFSIELPQFLELMVVKTEELEADAALSASNRLAILETGAKLQVPLFVDSGDYIKVDPAIQEYVQRV